MFSIHKFYEKIGKFRTTHDRFCPYWGSASRVCSGDSLDRSIFLNPIRTRWLMLLHLLIEWSLVAHSQCPLEGEKRKDFDLVIQRFSLSGTTESVWNVIKS